MAIQSKRLKDGPIDFGITSEDTQPCWQGRLKKWRKG